MIQLYRNEEFRELNLHESLKLRYAISNYGRLVSFTDEVRNGRELKGGLVEGYKCFRYKIREGGVELNRNALFHRLVAEYFLKKPSEKYTHVIHLDFDKTHNVVENLKYATREEQNIHSHKSPLALQHKQNMKEGKVEMYSKKLTLTKVIQLKKRILDPNRKTRLKIIAREFGVSEMAITRMKRGENWGHVEVSVKPLKKTD